ncbi:efflux RND transporter periplasmic adaptor subunit [Pseudomonas tructae]|uniref:Efflux RND transporter periplasmic adaptor subunit n=1 Tax=Pseudomonas tructae TaxID=2518644 RepID=A0A411MKM6_9PSED|nr:efflux RND transporter periplasmic adaptor subunit [Pseudomonas tructae]QBF27339.1 efflux RND transporter periplasmic adaptor subunit [Pseudomonas tructae]
MNRKNLALGTVLVGAAIALLVLWQQPHSAQASAPPARTLLKVALGTVQRGPANGFFAGVGELEAARQVLVSAEIGGRVTRINFVSGQQVRRGDVLITLNDAPEQAERIRLQAQLHNARINHRRVRELLAENAATQEQLDNALAARDMASGELAHTEAVIAQKTIRAPFDGVLGIRKVNEGQYLKVGDALVSLIDPRTLYVNFSLDEQLSIHLKPGQAVEVLLDAYPERTFQARISAIDPLIERSRTVQVQATLDNADAQLKAGMYASVKVADPQVNEILSVPETAVTYTAYGDTVFLARHDEQQQALVVQRVPVKIGERQDGRVIILEGLQQDDQVVTSGQLKLSDGVAVEATEDTLQRPVLSGF